MNSEATTQVPCGKCEGRGFIYGWAGQAVCGECKGTGINFMATRKIQEPFGLGLFRKGNAILCYAWGETDVPDVQIAKTSDDVKAFFVAAWLGDVDDDDADLEEALKTVAEHDWGEGDCEWDFEIGGLRLEDVSFEESMK